MKRFSALTILLFVAFSAAACQTTAKLTDPCDVLVRIDPKPATATWLVRHDRDTAVAIARHRQRVETYRCGSH